MGLALSLNSLNYFWVTIVSAPSFAEAGFASAICNTFQFPSY